MVWFKVDDKLHDHRKIRQAGVAAMGLWILAGSWCSDNLTDGFVPETVLRRWEHNYRRLAERLVTAELWSAETVQGETGYRFHQWGERQPTRSDVEEERAEARQRMADLRAQKKARSEFVRANTERSSESVRSTRPDPTRPDQEVPTELPKRPTVSSRGTRLTEDWEPSLDLIAWVRSECPNVDGRTETANFRDYWISKAGKDATKVDWPATYRRWMRTAQERRPPERAGQAGISTGTQRAMAAVSAAQQIKDARSQQLQIGMA